MKKAFFVFKLYYVIYVLLAFHAVLSETTFIHYATALLSVAGAGVLLCMALQFRQYLSMKNVRLIAAFLASYVLSSLLMYRYGVGDNIKEMIWLVLTMAIVYASGFLYTTDEMKRELHVLSAVWIGYCTITNLVSISMVVWGKGYKIPSAAGTGTDGYKRIGFTWGRLWGLYDDPNHGATIAAAAILLALYLFSIAGKRWIKALLVLSILIQFDYIVLSDSRTGVVTLAAGVCVWGFVWIYQKSKQKNSVPGAVGIGMLAGFLSVVLIIGGAYGCKQQYNAAIDRLEASLPEKYLPFLPEQIGRSEDLEGNASNGRVDIWKSGLEIAKTSPVYGVSYRNMTAYAEENLPDTYLVNNAQHTKYDSLHNSVMDILVSQGIIGIGILFALIGNTIWLMRKKLSVVREKDIRFMTACFAIMASMAAGSLFISMVFYLNGPQTFIFWLCFGYFVTILQKGECAG